MKAHELLSRLDGVKKQSKGWIARCPAHDDKKASLSINDGEKGVVLKCFVGCTTAAICEAMGLKEANLFYEETRSVNRWESYLIKDTQGRTVAVRKRKGTGENKQLLWELPNGKRGLGGLKTADLPLFGSENLKNYDRQRWIDLHEGEAKTWAARSLGAQALGTSTGASAIPSRQVLESLRGFRVRLWPDNDDPGRLHMKRIANELRALGIECVVLDTRGLPPKGDIVQWIESQLQSGKTKSQLREDFAKDELPGLSWEARNTSEYDATPRQHPQATGNTPCNTSEYDATPRQHPLSLPAKAMTFEELMALKVEPRAELCGPWLKERTLTEVYGWRGAGKSWFGLSLAFAVASGVDFMRWSVPEAKGVLYVDGEMDLEDIQERLKRIHKGEQKRAGRALQPKLRYLADSHEGMFPNGLPKLSTEEGKALVEANLDGISLVVLDNLSTLYNSAIENDAESWVEAQDWLVSLRRRGISVVFVHHAGKGGQQRGSSKREDVINNVIALKQPEDKEAEEGCAFTLKFEKSRGVKGPSVAPLSAKLTEDEDGDLVWAISDAKETKAAQMQEMKDAGMGVREIARVLKLNPSTVSRSLAKVGARGGVLPVAPPYKVGGQQQHSLEPNDATQQATPHATPEKKQTIPMTYVEPQSNTPRNTPRNTVQCSALREGEGQATPHATPREVEPAPLPKAPFNGAGVVVQR